MSTKPPTPGGTVNPSPQILLKASARILKRWANLLTPHYGPTGSLDLDLLLYPDAEGPSQLNQFAHYALLLLSEKMVDCGASPADRETWRNLALRNLQYILSITGDDFKQPLYSRGREWERVHGEWMIFFLQRSLRIVDERRLGTKSFRAHLARVVDGAAHAAFKEFHEHYEPFIGGGERERGFPGNHAAWFGALFYELGRFQNNLEWTRFSERFFKRLVLPWQREDGLWSECGGMVAIYSMVTAQAVSVYADASGDGDAMTAVGRFLAGYKRITFPDFSVSCVADSRAPYSEEPFYGLPIGFPSFQGGGEFCLGTILAGERRLRRVPMRDNQAQITAFFAVFAASLLPDRTPRIRSAPPGVSTEIARVESPYWRGLLSVQINREIRGRWALDTQNFIDLWSPCSGLIAGGGSSKYSPLFSSLREIGGSRGYIPTRARILKNSARFTEAEYLIGSSLVRVELQLRGKRTSISWRRVTRRKIDVPLEAAIILVLRKGDILRTNDGQVFHVDPDNLMEFEFSGGCSKVMVRGVCITPPAGAFLRYPIQIWNSYTQNSLGGPIRARLSWPVSNRETTLHLQVE
jgi:hypothetical protein